MLNNAHASPGAIDGSSGKNTLKAIASFQQMNGLKPTGTLTQETWNTLLAKQGSKPAFVEYTITEADLKGPYVASIPHDYALQSKMKGLYYTRVTEMLGEKFHMDEDFLKKLNPKATFKKAGEKIIVANIRNEVPEDIHLIVAHKGAKQLYLFNSRNQMIGSFPATIGSSDTPSPTGTYKVTGVARNPWYSYSPSNFVQGNNTKPLSLPPGPNAPVGNIWIGLSKKSFGIHGTPNPSAISKTASHGCIRLTNWDANDLGKKVKSGVTVKFLE
jgi:lipoprotein-anchoring transpeptidase ErfK/SrfK